MNAEEEKQMEYNHSPTTPLTIESMKGDGKVEEGYHDQTTTGNPPNDDVELSEDKKVTPRILIHSCSRVFLIIFTCCPICCHIIFAIISSLLWYATVTQDGNDKIWFHILSGLQYTVGLLIFLCVQCIICLFVIFIRKLHFVVLVVVYLYGFANIGFVIYALVITIRSPIVDRWPNPGEWGLLVWNWALGLCAFTGFVTSLLYFASRPKKKNCLV